MKSPWQVTAGNQLQLTASLHNVQGGYRDITTSSFWESSDTGVATIDQNGLATTYGEVGPTTPTEFVGTWEWINDNQNVQVVSTFPQAASYTLTYTPLAGVDFPYWFRVPSLPHNNSNIVSVQFIPQVGCNWTRNLLEGDWAQVMNVSPFENNSAFMAEWFLVPDAMAFVETTPGPYRSIAEGITLGPFSVMIVNALNEYHIMSSSFYFEGVDISRPV